MEDASQEVCIILAVYQGAEFLDEQLESYVGQSHKNWSLIVSDDGSTDNSLSIIDGFNTSHPDIDLTIQQGPQKGFAANFFSLLGRVPKSPRFAALSDQDDIWFDEKIARGVKALSNQPDDIPCLYCSRTEICDENLQPIGLSPQFDRPPSFRNALVQSLGGGNTMMLNRAAIDLVQDIISEHIPEVVAHDWWLYQIITACGGTAIYDPTPTLLYRQHEANLIGSNLSRWAKLHRIYLLISGRFKTWNQINCRALEANLARFGSEEAETFKAFGAARRGSIFKRFQALRKSGVYRQSWMGNIALYYACFINRL